MMASLTRFLRFLYVGIILAGVSIAATGVAAADPPIRAGDRPVLLSVEGSSGPHLVALPDTALARTTGTGFTPPAVAVRIPSRGRVTLWDELNIRPSDLSAATGQVSITIKNH